MSAPSDGARADARKARLAIADMVGIFAHLQPGAVSERVSGLADLIVADTDEPMWSAVVIAKHILASDWLAGVIADAKAEALREAADEIAVDAKSVYYRDDSTFHASQRWALTDTAPDWLRDRAKRIEQESGR